MRTSLTLMIASLIQIVTIVNARAEDPTGLIGIAGALLKPSGINVATTHFARTHDSWSMRVMVAFRYAPQEFGSVEIAPFDVLPHGFVSLIEADSGRTLSGRTEASVFRGYLESSDSISVLLALKNALQKHSDSLFIGKLTDEGHEVTTSLLKDGVVIGHINGQHVSHSGLLRHLPMRTGQALVWINSRLDTMKSANEIKFTCVKNYYERLSLSNGPKSDYVVDRNDGYEQYRLSEKVSESSRWRWSYSIGYQYYLRTDPISYEGVSLNVSAGGPSINGVGSYRLFSWLRIVGGFSVCGLTSRSIVANFSDVDTIRSAELSSATSFTVESILGFTFSHPSIQPFAFYIDGVLGLYGIRNVHLPTLESENSTITRVANNVPRVLFDQRTVGVQFGIGVTM